MKRKIINASLFVTGILIMVSCKKSFLDVPVQGQATTATDPSLAQNLVIGVYNSLLTGEAFGGNDIHGFAFISATNIMSDDADKGSTANDQLLVIGPFDDFTTLTSTNPFAGALWSGYYNGIARTNQALAALSTAALDTATKNTLQAEVRFIRGYYYFNMVRLFGAVPRVLRVPTSAADANSDPAFQTRASADTIYNTVIIPDLQYGIDHLPVKGQKGYSVGHVTKGAAESMLAKVYMYRKNWQQVLNLTQDVINSGQYSLVPDYSTIWRQVGDNNAESIFEIETGQFNNTDFGVQNYCTAQGPRVGGAGGWSDLGFGFCNPSVNLINAYEANDKRKAATIIFIDNSGTHIGTTLFDGFRIPSSDSVQNLYYNYKAYHSENGFESYLGNRDFKQKNIHILRYAEVLLMNAEAAAQLGNSGLALTDLNLVRTRAGLPNAAIADQNAIWKERRVELAMEHDRFWDLVRQGRAAQVMQAAGKAFAAGKHELLPVPSVQIQLSGNKLTQNPGY
jgi:starch-binding outer membrane protein, SusD/RagB family